MRFSLGVIATRHTASLYANVKHVIYRHKKSAAYSYLPFPKNINTDGVGGWVGLQHVWTAPKKQVKKGAKTVKINMVGSRLKPPPR